MAEFYFQSGSNIYSLIAYKSCKMCNCIIVNHVIINIIIELYKNISIHLNLRVNNSFKNIHLFDMQQVNYEGNYSALCFRTEQMLLHIFGLKPLRSGLTT